MSNNKKIVITLILGLITSIGIALIVNSIIEFYYKVNGGVTGITLVILGIGGIILTFILYKISKKKILIMTIPCKKCLYFVICRNKLTITCQLLTNDFIQYLKMYTPDDYVETVIHHIDRETSWNHRNNHNYIMNNKHNGYIKEIYKILPKVIWIYLKKGDRR